MAARGGWRRGCGALLLGLLLAGAWPAAAGAADPVAFTIRDPRIAESSGLAADAANGIYWTVNDSDGGVVYGLDPDGDVRGTLRYRATPRDVEAVAVDGTRLYVADIGDGEANRTMVTVYFLTNPRASGLTVTYNSFDFRYADGPHDAETLLVDGDGRLYVVTKDAEGGAIYRAPQEPSRGGTNVLTRVGDAPAEVTDGVFLPDGQIALLTAESVTVVDGRTYASRSSIPIPRQEQAESLSLNLSGDGLLVGSEGRTSKVYALPLPGQAASVSPTPSPSASSSAPANAGGDPEAEEDAPAAGGRRGTLLAVGLAGVLALVAGVVVAVIRRP